MTLSRWLRGVALGAVLALGASSAGADAAAPLGQAAQSEIGERASRPQVSGHAVPAALTSQMKVPHTFGKYSSYYDLYVGAIDRSKPVGVLFYFDADSSKASRFRYLDKGLMERLKASAARRNLVFVAAHTPGGPGKYGLYNWWDDPAKGVYARNLGATVISRYRLDPSQVWMTGWSGGAELVTKELMSRGQTWFSGGGAIVMGGGEAARGVYRPPASVRAMPMRWYIGDRDGYGATVPKSWSARKAAERGLASYRRAGFTDLKLVTVRNQGHFYDVAAVIERGLAETFPTPNRGYPVRGDVVGINRQGQVWNYHGHGRGLEPRTRIASGWENFIYHEQTDWNRDGIMDVFVKHRSGRLYVYLGRRGGGYREKFQVGHGFTGYRVFTGATCSTCRPFLFGRHPDGRFFRWKNTRNGYVSGGTQIGHRWNSMEHIIPVDWDDNGHVDVAAVDGSGTMWLYSMKGGRFRGGRRQVGQRWNFAAIAEVPGFRGRDAILARRADGTVLAYPHWGRAFRTQGRGVIAKGWETLIIAGED
ncbi:MAG: hypothetical protein Q4P36_09530 [Bowdeniella nasicola]|nr:hypothetical protein [Bowdeniella nasicola]